MECICSIWEKTEHKLLQVKAVSDSYFDKEAMASQFNYRQDFTYMDGEQWCARK